MFVKISIEIPVYTSRCFVVVTVAFKNRKHLFNRFALECFEGRELEDWEF
jgi:hypothetical protein